MINYDNGYGNDHMFWMILDNVDFGYVFAELMSFNHISLDIPNTYYILFATMY